ncbi:MAG: DUF3352 domain-containing protein [Pyrinomonadaceae bacterium]|nr:DUF3352 domain-containing protein [Pyrinomonadaceae bacterium]
MKMSQIAAIAIRLLLTLFLIAAPISAQRRRPAAPKPPPPPAKPAQPELTFETILAADSYKIYGEVRGVGQLLRSAGVNDILDPVMKLASPPKEFKTLVRWLNSHADELMTSRLMFAAWASRPNLPQALFVIEFPTAEEAQKFEPHLKTFLPKFLPTPAPESSPSPGSGKNEPSEAKTTSIGPPSFFLKQSGALVFISDSQFAFKALRPKGSKLLTEDPNFRQVHDRLSSESVFVYFDVASAEREDQERMLRMQEEEKRRQESAAANPTPPEVPESGSDDDVPDFVPEEHTSVTSVELGPPQPAEDQFSTQVVVKSGPDQETPVASFPGLDRLASSLFFGRPKWPDAIGFAINFDADTYIVRALMISGPETKVSAIPFAPQLISGPPLAPEASTVLPANTELLVTLSLDLPQIYEGTLKTLRETSVTSGPNVKVNQPETPFAAYEKKLGLKIKEDVLPLFGNEIALSVPVKALGVGPQSSAAAIREPGGEGDAKEPDPVSSATQPVIAISIKDKEAVRTLIPKIIDAIGVKGASLLAQTEKRDDTELVTFANVISYAFIGNFLVVSPDAKAVRNVVDAYLNHQTLAGNSGFRNSTRWQPRQVLGQVYVSPALMESLSAYSKDLNLITNDVLRDFISRLSPTAEPVSYAISNEGLGPLHELRIPKNLVLLMIGGIASESSQPPVTSNEAGAQGALRTIVVAEELYKTTVDDGNYGTFDQLVEKGMVRKEHLQQNGYKIELTASGTKFEASAVPIEYGKTGRMSFFVDESGVLRGADIGGGFATAADKPVQ